MSYTLFNRQKEIEPKLLAGSFVLNWDMRLGKTRAVLHAFNESLMRGGPRTLIVVCPSIAKGVWEQEARDMGLDIPTVILDGITRKRASGDAAASAALGIRMFIVNWEILDAHLLDLQLLRDFVLVLDETHKHCANPSNARYKAARDLSFIADRVWILTGTLYKTSALDLHWQLRLLGPSLYPYYFDTADSFGRKFCHPKELTFYVNKHRVTKVQWKGIQKGTEHALVGLPVIDRRLEEVTELPHSVDWWLDEGDKYEYDGGEQEGSMALARSELSVLKAKRTVELIRANNLLDGPLVIFGWHKKFINGVAAELRDNYRIIDGSVSSEEKSRIARSFANREFGVVIANIESAGVAVDLATARNAVFGEIDWTKTNMIQAEARIRGPKQKHRPCYWYALCLNSVDEFVWRTMLARGRDMKRLDAAKLAS